MTNLSKQLTEKNSIINFIATQLINKSDDILVNPYKNDATSDTNIFSNI